MLAVMTSINLADRAVDLGEWARSTPDATEEFTRAVREWLAHNWDHAYPPETYALPVNHRKARQDFSRKVGAKGWLGDDYANVKFGLRMNIISKPGVDKANFELWNTAVSAINGCEHCLGAHAHELNEAGLSKEQVWEAVKVAAVVQAVAQAVQIEAAR